MTCVQVVCLNGAFAVAAIFSNLFTQRPSLTLCAGASALPRAICLGIPAGLAVKFHLGKRWIFRDAPAEAQSWKFGLYTLTGAVTTLVFRGTEYSFGIAWLTDLMREASAVLGLSIGYLTKYHLDKRFVFAAPRGLGNGP